MVWSWPSDSPLWPVVHDRASEILSPTFGGFGAARVVDPVRALSVSDRGNVSGFRRKSYVSGVFHSERLAFGETPPSQALFLLTFPGGSRFLELHRNRLVLWNANLE